MAMCGYYNIKPKEDKSQKRNLILNMLKYNYLKKYFQLIFIIINFLIIKISKLSVL